jgi:hypothetical protein
MIKCHTLTGDQISVEADPLCIKSKNGVCVVLWLSASGAAPVWFDPDEAEMLAKELIAFAERARERYEP